MLMLVSYLPVHAALDIVMLTNLNISGSAVSFVIVANVFIALAIVWSLFWAIDRARPPRTSVDIDT